MSSTELTFKLVNQSQCPFYDIGDKFKLSGNALLLKFEGENTFISTAIVRFPGSKENCRTLIGDLTNLLIQYENINRIPSCEIDCSGCNGSARLQYEKEKLLSPAPAELPNTAEIQLITSLLSNFSIFRSLDETHLKSIVSLLKLKKYPKGAIVIKKGDPAQNLFIILSGSVHVLDENDACLSILKKGDVFGEMSLISGDAVGATIKVAEPSSIAFIQQNDFNQIFNQFSSIQTYLTRMLAKRLARSNIMRAEQITSGMTGQLSELSVMELLQALNLSQKSGILSLKLAAGPAELFLKEGHLVKARYNDMKGRDAIYAVVREKEGRFNFDPKLPDEFKDTPIIGSMMEILLDASRIIDESP